MAFNAYGDGYFRHAATALLYADALPFLQRVSNDAGYALAVHGSLSRDCDLVAVPWTPDAIPAEELINWLCERAGVDEVKGPEKKPHGRIAWSLMLSKRVYIDISVMPRTPEQPSAMSIE